jgi:hypothetical protein
VNLKFVTVAQANIMRWQALSWYMPLTRSKVGDVLRHGDHPETEWHVVDNDDPRRLHSDQPVPHTEPSK